MGKTAIHSLDHLIAEVKVGTFCPANEPHARNLRSCYRIFVNKGVARNYRTAGSTVDELACPQNVLPRPVELAPLGHSRS